MTNKTDKKYIIVTCRLPKNLFDKLDAHCNKTERSKSYVIKHAMDFYLDTLEQIDKDTE